MGNISYSLYLIHGVAGFVMMYWLMNRGIQPVVAMVAAVFCGFLVASMFYWVIENSFIERKMEKSK